MVQKLWSQYATASSMVRETILLGLLELSSMPQLTQIHRALIPVMKMDLLSHLPVEIAIRVLHYLDAQSLCRAAQVSRQWALLANDPDVWHFMCFQHIGKKCLHCNLGLPVLQWKSKRLWHKKEPEKDLKELKFDEHNMESKISSNPLNSNSPGHNHLKRSHEMLNHEENRRNLDMRNVRPKQSFPDNSNSDDLLNLRNIDFRGQSTSKKNWKKIFQERFLVERNWRKNQFQPHTLIPPISSVQPRIMDCCLDELFLMTAGMDGVVNIWSLENNTLIQKLVGHLGAVTCVHFDESKNLALSGGMDGTVRIWNYVTGTCVRSLTGGHNVPVTSIHFDQGILASADAASLIRVWDFSAKSCFSLYHGNLCTFVKVRLCKGYLYSAGDYGGVRMWDLKTRSCDRTFMPPPLNETALSDLQSESLSRGINPNTAVYSPILSLHVAPVYLGGIFAVYVLTGSADGRLHLYLASNLPSHKHTLSSVSPNFGQSNMECRPFRTFNHGAAITSARFDCLRIFSCGVDGLLKIWDINNGNLLQTHSIGGTMGVMDATETHVVCSKEDGLIKVWDFRTK